jgi:hypothetical protein
MSKCQKQRGDASGALSMFQASKKGRQLEGEGGIMRRLGSRQTMPNERRKNQKSIKTPETDPTETKAHSPHQQKEHQTHISHD